MFFEVILCVAVTFCSVYLYFKYKFTYWLRKGVPHLAPSFPYGNRLKEARQTGLLLRDHYAALKHSGLPFFGMYFMHNPVAIPTSPKLIKAVLVRDFPHFTDRGIYYNADTDPLSAHLFALSGPEWRSLRHLLTPTFTSGKMKFMYPTIVEVAARFEQCLAGIDGQGQAMELKELLVRYTVDIIGTCSFGIECNSMKDPKAEFLRMGQSLFSAPRYPSAVSTMVSSFQGIARMLGAKVFPDDVTEFFRSAVRETVSYREANAVRRNDFLDLLIDLKKEGQINVEQLAAQCFLFFIAGFETSATTMMYALYELSVNQDIQIKVRAEINDVLQKHDGRFTYEAMQNMHYLEQVVNETLRKYPPVTSLLRKTNSAYHVPDTNVVLPGGTLFVIPVYAIHHDAEIYPNPDVFDPDRFSAESIAKQDRSLFLPFGDGPRNCIGLRFGKMQTRVGLVSLLMNYEFSLTEKTPVPIVFEKKSFVLTPDGGMWLNIRRI